MKLTYHFQEYPVDEEVNDDEIIVNEYLPWNCVHGDIKTITELKQMPVCVNVTKKQCDTKWEINADGEKVWAGNDNCHDVTWQDCTLEEREVTIEVPTFDCALAENPIVFQNVRHQPAEFTVVKRECKPIAKPVCSVTMERRCKEVEWDDCVENVESNCFDALFKIPFQEFNHLIRCPITH